MWKYKTWNEIGEQSQLYKKKKTFTLAGFN